ncbi:hypothetical protein [Pontibacter kalidii]|uniref:hypothetical protein n=1 Tax=Pontibacter kalidii TaxID=2592049 RepID=UPI00225C3A01|nr:hypothetical protein [Pontibacter kalidii]
MNKEIESIRSNTILFTVELVKKSLSDWLVDEIIEMDKEYENNPILKIELNTNQAFNQLKEFINREIKHRDSGLFESCIEELREIKDDLKWLKSEDGRFILKLEDWVHGVRSKLESEGWNRVFVGRSLIDPKQLNIGGLVKDEIESNKIKAKIEQWAPPVPPQYYLEIE